MRYQITLTILTSLLAIVVVAVVPLDLLAYMALWGGPIVVLSACVGLRDL